MREVGDNVVDVIISADELYKAVLKTNDNTNQQHETNCQQDGPAQGNAGSISNIPPDIMDLTDGDDEMDVVHILETQDRKPIWIILKIDMA